MKPSVYDTLHVEQERVVMVTFFSCSNITGSDDVLTLNILAMVREFMRGHSAGDQCLDCRHRRSEEHQICHSSLSDRIIRQWRPINMLLKRLAWSYFW